MTGRGWPKALGLALAVLLLSTVQPLVLVLVPLGLLLVALPPRRPHLVVLGLLLVALALLGPRDMLWYAERGWTLLLGAWFVVLVAMWPGRYFLPRGVAAVAAATVSAGLVLAVQRDGWEQVDWALSRMFREAAATFTAEFGGGGTAEVVDVMVRAADLQALLYPALLALGSLAALALAWWGYRRLVAGDSPLRPLREFRFRDDMVWVLIGGLALVVLPLGGAALRTGWNVAAFMAALYALRGAGVLLALVGTPGPAAVVLAVLATLLLYPVVMLMTVLIGLTDTWLDLRARGGSGTEGAS